MRFPSAPHPGVELTQPTEENHSKRLDVLDFRAAEDMRLAIRYIDTLNYDYIDAATFVRIERGLIALAALHGAKGVIDVEGAIKFLVSGVDEWEKEKLELEGTISRLEGDLSGTEADLRKAQEKITAFEEEEAEAASEAEEDIVSVIYLEKRQRDELSDTLGAVSALLSRVPGQQELSVQVLAAYDVIRQLETRDVIEVDDEGSDDESQG